ncbi:MAG: hypothetical protein PHQ93_06465 [Sulfurimonas sp.]|uniref:hypothetical protein n=1 Tax=Sulfurimonas sp. TaxID=2022749 RepID=UPI0026059B47|nr:hypothetical protein [Sulfurimonas sp.]MDD5400809.1 hypothetical protein [Sulfurimonas sp.]
MKNFKKLHYTNLMKDGRTNGKYKKLYKKLMTKKEIKTIDKIFEFMEYACNDFVMHDIEDSKLVKLANKFTLIEQSISDKQWEIANFISQTLTQHQEDFFPEYILDEIDNFGTEEHFKKYGKEYREKYLKYQILLTIDTKFSEAIGCLYYEIENNRDNLKPKLTLNEHMFGKKED